MSASRVEYIRQNLLLTPSSFPHEWHVIKANKKSIVVRIGKDILGKRTLRYQRREFTIPASRIVREAEAAKWLGSIVPPPIYVEKKTGILIRQFIEGELLSSVLREPLAYDYLAVAQQVGRWLSRMIKIKGPKLEPRGITIPLNIKLAFARKMNAPVINELAIRIQQGESPSHGDLTGQNIVVNGDQVCFIDGETFDCASPAWDLAHLITAPLLAGQSLPEWQQCLYEESGLSATIIRDAELTSAALLLFWLNKPGGRSLNCEWRTKLRTKAENLINIER